MLLLASLCAVWAAAQPVPGHRAVAVRLPTWELATMTAFRASVEHVRPLLPGEIDEAREVFGEALDYSAVRVGVGGDKLIGVATTWGNLIRVAPSEGFPRYVLMHELAHVWQYQSSGTAYITDSSLHQAKAWLTGGDKRDRYDYKLAPGKRLVDYDAEQQAQIVEDYATDSRKAKDPRYQVLIAELKSYRAVKGLEDVVRERDECLPPRYLPPETETGPRVMPQLELSF